MKLMSWAVKLTMGCILLGTGFHPVHAQQAAADSSATQDVFIEEEEELADEISSPDTSPSVSPATPMLPPIQTPALPAAAEETGLVVEEGDEDIFTIGKEMVGPLADSTAAAVAPPAKTPAPEENFVPHGQDETDRYQRYRGRIAPSAETPPLTPAQKIIPDQNESAATVVTEKPVTIESVRSINFAKNLKEYRSPKTAMFMSLLLPGLGQAYSRRYVKSAIFGVVEVALVTMGIKFAVDGKRAKDDAWKFADAHFSQQRFWTYYSNLRTNITNTVSKNVSDNDQSTVEKRVAEIMKDGIFMDDSTKIRENFIKRPSSYYELLEIKSYSQGWDDSEPVFVADGSVVLADPGYSYTYVPYSNADTTWLFYCTDKISGDTLNFWADKEKSWVYGYSPNQGAYRDKLSASNRAYGISRNMVLVLIANHMVSAVDALVSAKRHNDRLLGRQSVWERIHFDHQIAYANRDFVSTVGVKVRF